GHHCRRYGTKARPISPKSAIVKTNPGIRRGVMSTSPSPAAQVDIGEAFGYVFRSRNWFGRLALGALCLLFFWAILIPVFILLGYFVETARVISAGARELPPWEDIGKKLREGFVLAVVLFIWGLPGSIP